MAIGPRYPANTDTLGSRVFHRRRSDPPSPPAAERQATSGIRTIELDYPVRSQPRYGFGRPPHPELARIIGRGRERYAATLAEFARYVPRLLEIPVSAPAESPEPRWVNGYLPGLDSAALYSFVASTDPALYLEIGSGHSTTFVRRAISDHGLRTRIVSIDPQPRAEIDAICDRVVRTPLEDTDLAVFGEVRAGDIVFFDGSHRVFMNSDVAVFFLEVLPRLPSDVLVQVHDIRLPYDYYPDWAQRFYSEQYVLAAYLLADGPHVETVLPNAFISGDPELSHALDALFDDPRLAGAERHGDSYWMRTRR